MQGEHKWGDEGGREGGEEDGRRSVPLDNGVAPAGVGEEWSEREQSASWGRDIGVSNKQTTDTNTSAARGLFLNTHNVAD